MSRTRLGLNIIQLTGEFYNQKVSDLTFQHNLDLHLQRSARGIFTSSAVQSVFSGSQGRFFGLLMQRYKIITRRYVYKAETSAGY